jgi:hypothetical protein
MKKRSFIIVTVAILFSTCGTNDQASQDEISGKYVREYSFKIVNPETSTEIGMRTIRDTVFIRPVGEKYEVSNRKWKLNDYDKEGWQNMEHTEDRSMPMYQAIFNSTDGTLDSESLPQLFLDLGKGELFKDQNRDKPYQKLR